MTAPRTQATLTGFRGNGPSYQDLLDVDSKPVPASLRRDEPGYFGDADIPIDRYLSREFHELEKTRLWSRVWQFACREEVLAEVGDTEVYDICDRSILLVRAAPGPDGIKAYYNACLHRGRTLRDERGHVDELLCAFHGFCWSLNGRLKRVPSAWDFPQVTSRAVPAARSTGRNLGRVRLHQPRSGLRAARGFPRGATDVLRPVAVGGPVHAGARVEGAQGELEGCPRGIHGVLPRHHDPSSAAARFRRRQQPVRRVRQRVAGHLGPGRAEPLPVVGAGRAAATEQPDRPADG